MTTLNWIGIGIMVLIVIIGSLLYVLFKKKLEELDGFEGLESERDTNKAAKQKPFDDD